VLIDEVHLLNDKDRGHILEVLVCRLKTHCCPARYVGMCATFPNVEDIAFWLGGSDCVFFKFGEEVRPVKLRRVVMGFYRYEGQNQFMFEMNLSYKIEKILQDYGESMPTLVFCNSRKSTMSTCTVLAKKLRNMVMGKKRNQMMSLASRLRDPKLKTMVKEHGV
jgi:ATP-dependent DNA helicase HFM1/MER3